MRLRQQGLSLIELMIALALGLILTLAVTQIFIASRHTYSVVTGQSETSENGRVASFLLRRALQEAGYWDTWGNPDAQKLFPAASSMAQGVVVTGTNDDGLNSSDTITLRFTGAADGGIESCLGNAPGNNSIVVERYYLKSPGTGLEPELMCDATITNLNGTTTTAKVSQPLIEGVENMQILYGIGNATSVTQYVKAGDVADWTKVRSIKFAILAASSADTAGLVNSKTYVLLDKSVTAPGTDKRPRQVYTDIVALRNYLGS